ncbi:MAG: hypothetical protein E4G99_09560 [Anaerolineales bacterium]|nr:MAG: hypothetical protein E4G99_09560 [Anaerolineales bacterium]
MNENNSENLIPGSSTNIIFKLLLPTLLILLIPVFLSVTISNIQGTYGELIKGVFLFSGELFTFGPLNRLDRLIEDGNLLATAGANVLPIAIASLLIYRSLAKTQNQKLIRFVISLLWGIVSIEIIGAALAAVLAILLSNVGY